MLWRGKNRRIDHQSESVAQEAFKIMEEQVRGEDGGSATWDTGTPKRLVGARSQRPVAAKWWKENILRQRKGRTTLHSR